jgi:hypothetical protein
VKGSESGSGSIQIIKGLGFWRPRKLTDLDLAPDPEHCGNRATKKRSEEKAKGLFLKVQKSEKIEQNVEKEKKR